MSDAVSSEGAGGPGGRTAYPLAAMVGCEEVVLALVLCAIDPGIGGVLLRGEKGSGKTTAARGLAELLPGSAPFVELPLGAGEDRVVGSFDLRAALGAGEHRFQPGLLQAAHGGVLYVDEMNLLADHLVDVLLDAAATGVNRVERDGISRTHPSRFVLVGSMNPEEGELRPQLLDRFGLSVAVAAPTDPALRAEAVRRRLAFDADPEAFRLRWHHASDDLRRRLASARPAALASGIEDRVAHLCATAGVEGLRSDLVICRAAAALAGWEGRDEAADGDVRRVAALALAHRRTSPWSPPAGSASRGPEERESASRESAGRAPGSHGSAEGPPEGSEEGTATGSAHRELDALLDRALGAGEPDGASGEPTGTGPPSGPRAQAPAGEGSSAAQSPPGPPSGGAPPPAPSGLLDPPARGSSGRIARTAGPVTGRKAGHFLGGEGGRQVGSRRPDPRASLSAIAPLATVAAAAERQAGEHRAGGVPLEVREEDLREAVRRPPVTNLVVMAVDTSGSMGVERRVATARDAVRSLLVDAYQRRDRVAVVAFRGTGAEVVLRPTGSTEVAQARLRDLPTGGQTPLAAGLSLALQVASDVRAGSCRPLVVLVSDGRATWAAGDTPPMAAALAAAAAVRRAGFESLVIDCELGMVRLALAARLAEAMGGTCVPAEALTEGTLTATSALRRP